MKITIAAPAKVNLWLRVGPADRSGYHPLSTLFCALDLADTVIIRRRRSPDASPLQAVAGAPLDELPELGDTDANLAVRAARAFLERAGEADAALPGIRLIKRIPVGGGLGGGSSDAAAVLRAMRRLHARSPAGDAILELAGEIGSDIPFFVLGTPLAHGTGRGELLTPLPPLPPRPVVLVLPPFGVGTREAYRWLDEERESTGAELPSGLDPGPAMSGGGRPALTWDAVAERAVNDFEGPVFRHHPELRAVRDALLDKGARPALLAGSGSSVFGVFGDSARAAGAVRALQSQFPGHRVIATGTRVR